MKTNVEKEVPEGSLKHSWFGELMVQYRLLIVHARELLLRAGKGFVPGHITRKWQSLDQKTGLLVLCSPYTMSPKHRTGNEFTCNGKTPNKVSKSFLAVQVLGSWLQGTETDPG